MITLYDNLIAWVYVQIFQIQVDSNNSSWNLSLPHDDWLNNHVTPDSIE